MLWKRVTFSLICILLRYIRHPSCWAERVSRSEREQPLISLTQQGCSSSHTGEGDARDEY